MSRSNFCSSSAASFWRSRNRTESSGRCSRPRRSKYSWVTPTNPPAHGRRKDPHLGVGAVLGVGRQALHLFLAEPHRAARPTDPRPTSSSSSESTMTAQAAPVAAARSSAAVRATPKSSIHTPWRATSLSPTCRGPRGDSPRNRRWRRRGNDRRAGQRSAGRRRASPHGPRARGSRRRSPIAASPRSAGSSRGGSIGTLRSAIAAVPRRRHPEQRLPTTPTGRRSRS